MVAPAETPAEVGEVEVHVRRTERRLRRAEENAKRACDLVGRLDTNDELQLTLVGVEPREARLRLQEHRIHGLGLEAAVEHEQVRIVGAKAFPDFLPEGGRRRIGPPSRNGQGCPDRATAGFELARANPPLLKRRVDVGGIRCGARNAGKAKGAVVRAGQRPGLCAEPDQGLLAKEQPRLVERVEFLKEQEGERLAQVQGGSARGAEQIAGVEIGDDEAGTRHVVCRDDHGWPCSARKLLEVEPVKPARGFGRADEKRVSSLDGPPGHVGGAEIRSIKLGTRDLGNPVDPTHASRGRVPALASRQGLVRIERRLGGTPDT